MTDQEFEREFAGLMSDPSGKQKKKGFGFLRRWKSLSRRRKLITGAAAFAAALAVLSGGLGGKKNAGLPVVTAPLEKGDIQERLSISGPVSGTDSAEVVSRLHAEILELSVKEGDRVKAGQVLARLDPADVQKEVDIAENAYNLAVAERDEAQVQAVAGYGKALQEERAARKDFERKSVLYENGDVSKAEMEAVQDALSEASRQVATYTVKDGKAVANQSYELRIKNAEFELEKKRKELEETEITSPIDGTVVRVNTKVGRFADTVDDDKPLFVIDDLDSLEMKIDVSEYSIGKVKPGQTAEITADILDGEAEQGIITAISPTGEEKGGGSTERVIPTTIQITNPDTKLIAGITARAQIVLDEAKDTWVVPMGALLEKDGNTYLAAVENHAVRLIPVRTGVESDVAVEVIGDGLTEGCMYIVSPDPSMEDGMAVMAAAP